MLVEIVNLRVTFPSSKGDVTAVDGISLEIPKGSVFGLAGESGCGKTTTGLTLLRMIRPPGKVQGRIDFDGEDVLSYREEELRRFRWKEVSMIFQGAMNSLNPVKTVASQIIDVVLDHTRKNKFEAMKLTIDLIQRVGLPKDSINKFPHQLSGGQKQRVMIAMAIVLAPKLIIADEPTTALDVISQERILNLLKDIVREDGSTVLFISHDISVLAKMCDRIAIMYLGSIVEEGKTKDVLLSPVHPYTQALIDSNITVDRIGETVESIKGYPPAPINLLNNCRFSERCPLATEQCFKSKPPVVRVDGDHLAYCYHPRIGNVR